MDADDFDEAAIRGLPAPLPEGERILWQGAPDARALAWRAFGVRLAVAGFGALLAWSALGVLAADGPARAGLAVGAALQLAVALAAAGILFGLAFWTARTTVYTITTRRVCMRINLAMTVTLNIPFSRIESAALRQNGRTGDVSLALAGTDRFAWFLLWPHARPWRLARPEPTLRALPDAPRVAEVLRRAAAEAACRDGRHLVTEPAPGAVSGALVPVT